MASCILAIDQNQGHTKLLHRHVHEFLVSKETVVLCQWESETNLVSSHKLMKVELPL